MSASDVTEVGRAVARAAAAAFGGKATVRRYYDVPEKNWIDLLRCEDAPSPGLVTYSTVSLHEAVNVLEGEDIRVELAGVAPSTAERFPNALTWVALTIFKDHWLAAPGVVYPNVLRDEQVSMALEHLMLFEPFEWEQLSEVELPDGKKVHWLHALPISDAEYRFVVERGFYEFEDKLVAAEIDYTDLERASIV